MMGDPLRNLCLENENMGSELDQPPAGSVKVVVCSFGKGEVPKPGKMSHILKPQVKADSLCWVCARRMSGI